MNLDSQLSAIIVFEFAFRILEAQSNAGANSISAKNSISQQLDNLPANDRAIVENAISALPIYKNKVKPNDKLMAAQFIPSVMLLSFCIELALKAKVKQSQNREIRGHKINLLYAELEESVRTNIRDAVIEKLQVSEQDFTDKLNANNDVFVNWRYFYEGSQEADLAFLKAFFFATKDQINWRT